MNTLIKVSQNMQYALHHTRPVILNSSTCSHAPANALTCQVRVILFRGALLHCKATLQKTP